MKMQSIGLIAVSVIILGLSINMAADKSPRKLGPEWKKDEEYYRRTVEIPLKRRVLDSETSTRYTIKMENHTLYVDETDGNKGLSVDCSQNTDIDSAFMKVQSRTDDEGKVREVTVNLKKNYYFDLDGDGMIDAMYDNRENKGIPMVIFEGQFVQVEDRISPFGGEPKGQTATAWGIGRKVQYRFKGSAWVAVPQ